MSVGIEVDTTTTAEVLEKLYALEKSHELDMEEARNIQRLMLPVGALRAGSVTIAHAFQPVTQVGGDFLDFYALPDGSIGLYLGDVCGKGLPAALYGALVVGTLRGVHKMGQSPSNVLATLNRRLTMRGIPRRYVVIQYAAFDPVSGEMQLASAGMCGPFHLSREGCREIKLSGLPPGMFVDAAYATHTLQIMPGESVVFCTDGIIEAVNPSGEFFGAERLVELCAAHANVPGPELLEHLFAAVKNFADGQAQYDDMAATVFHCAGIGEDAAITTA